MTEKENRIIEAMRKAVKDTFIYVDLNDNTSRKDLSDMDKGFIESCIELGEYGLAKNFLIDMYNYTEEEALVYVLQVVKELRKQR